MGLTFEQAEEWLGRHDRAFSLGSMQDVIDDYTEDAVLEVHTNGEILFYRGHDEILSALQAGSAGGIQTEARRIVVGQGSIAMQVCDPAGHTLIMSIWQVEDDKIVHDLAVIPAPPSA